MSQSPLPHIRFDEMDDRLDWLAMSAAIAAGHNAPRASLADGFASRGADTLLSRAAWIDGLGALVKAATVLPGNPSRGLASVQGGAMLFDDATGMLKALIDFHLLTKWKTAADSLLGAKLLANPEAEEILIIGAGTVAASLIDAYRALYPEAMIRIWSRTAANAARLVAQRSAHDMRVAQAQDLTQAIRAADIITTATMSQTPVLEGVHLRKGQHVNLIGAYRPDMREADDTALTRARIYVDSRATTLEHIGELRDPIARGVITPEDVKGDFYDLVQTPPAYDPDAITLFKNGGGAHLDLICAGEIYAQWQARA